MPRLKPLSRSARKTFTESHNRGHDISKKGKVDKDVSIGLMDIDAAIMYYFNKVIKPTVKEQDIKVPVPVLYANPERWKTIQKDGYLRDVKDQLITPLIVFKRVSVEKDETIPIDKLDANNPKVFLVQKKKYSSENRYDNFSVQHGLLPVTEYRKVAIPDFMLMNYECTIWTTYVEQMNRIIEKINWSDGSYWGEPDKFKFKVNINSFVDATEMDDSERIIKTTFSFSFRGYLIPESFNEYINTQLALTPKSIQIIDETGLNIISLFSPDSRAQTIRVIGGGIGPTIPRSLGRATDYIRGVASGVGLETQDLEFTNTFGGDTIYIMRGTGMPSSSADLKAVLTLGYANSSYYNSIAYFSGSQSSSLAADGSLYSPAVSASYQMRSDSVNVSINGVSLATGYDYYLTNDNDDVVIKSLTGSIGIDIHQNDDIIISYQTEAG